VPVKGTVVRVVLAVLLLGWIAPAASQLYRWVDPESGSVKYSSYPPPWFNDAASQGGAPKVEVIRPAKVAPAFAPEPEAGREPAAKPADRSPSREALLKQIAQRVSALVSAPPEAMGKAHGELAEPLQQLEKLDRQSRELDPKEEASRLEERWQLAVPLESRRTGLLQQIATQSPPPPGSARDRIEGAWANMQRLLAALGMIDSAIIAIDPRKANARHFEMNAMIDRTVEQWEPYVDAGILRKNRGR
jgi:hypothetical protein